MIMKLKLKNIFEKKWYQDDTTGKTKKNMVALEINESYNMNNGDEPSPLFIGVIKSPIL